MPFVSIFFIIDSFLFAFAVIRVYKAYARARMKEYVYYSAFLFIMALLMFIEGLPGVLIHDPTVINTINAVGHGFLLFIALAFVPKISFQMVKKPALGTFFFWFIAALSVISVYSNVAAHNKAIKLEGTLWGALPLIYWYPHFTPLSIALIVITCIVAMIYFPFLIMVLTVGSDTTRSGKTRAILTITGFFYRRTFWRKFLYYACDRN